MSHRPNLSAAPTLAPTPALTLTLALALALALALTLTLTLTLALALALTLTPALALALALRETPGRLRCEQGAAVLLRDPALHGRGYFAQRSGPSVHNVAT